MEIKELIENRATRIKLFEKSFSLFFWFHFWREFTDFQIDWMESLEKNTNTFIEWFRASRKTTIVKWYILRCIVYKKYNYIVWMSYADGDSVNNVTDIAKMLFKQSILDDYGQLFPLDVKQEDFAKKAQGNFDTTNKVKIQSKGLQQSTRWMNIFDMQWWKTERPNLIILDDVDVLKSVQNIRIIDQNEKKILWEVFGALDPTKNKRVFLGNTILEDWVVPRLRKLYWNNKWRECFRQPLFIDWVNQRPEVFTDKVLEEAKADGKVAFEQNYLLIPSVNGSGIFIRQYFDYFLESHFDAADSYLNKTDIRWWMFIDPATSSSDMSDDAVVMVLWEHRISKQYYLLDWYGGTSAPSVTIAQAISMYNKAIMWGYKIEFISCEDVTINKAQTDFVNDLRKALIEYQINVPLQTYTPKMKKEIRLQTVLEPVMSQKGIKFNRNISDFVATLEKQLLDFPNGNHDDHPDCLAQGIEVFRRKPEVKEQKERIVISSITRKQIQQVNQYRPRYSWLRWSPL